MTPQASVGGYFSASEIMILKKMEQKVKLLGMLIIQDHWMKMI
mgnify:CR=1 FL=1